MTKDNTIVLDEDTIDDILYCVRTNDPLDLADCLSTAAASHSTSQRSILLSTLAPETGNTALHYAAANGHDGLSLPLISVWFLTDTLADILATLLRHLSPAEEVVDTPNAAGSTPLHWAAVNGKLECAKKLVAAGAGVWKRDGAGNLPVFEAERAGHDILVTFLLEAGGAEEEERRRVNGDGKEEDAEEVESTEDGVEDVAGEMDEVQIRE